MSKLVSSYGLEEGSKEGAEALCVLNKPAGAAEISASREAGGRAPRDGSSDWVG